MIKPSLPCGDRLPREAATSTEMRACPGGLLPRPCGGQMAGQLCDWKPWRTFGGQVTALPNQSIGYSAQRNADTELATLSIATTILLPLRVPSVHSLSTIDSHGARQAPRRCLGDPLQGSVRSGHRDPVPK